MSIRSSGGTAAADASAWSADPLIGRVIDSRYRIEEVLGTGGVGVVYRAEHLKLQRQVAIKVLHEKLGQIDELRRRFEREGHALSALAHPNVVNVNDYGISEGMPYLVMELLEGRTLADLIDDDGPPDIDICLDIERQILRGLSFAHGNGIVHRDLKAANVFLQALPDDPHHVKLLDFGLAKIFTTEDGSSDPTLTKSGTILGTPAYMSPEQATGSSVDERADVYSAGVLFYELLTGRYPFEAPTRADMLRSHMLDPIPDAERARPGLSLTNELRTIIECAMSKERKDRYANAAAMLEAIDALPRPAAVFDPTGSSVSLPGVEPARSGERTLTTRGTTDFSAPPAVAPRAKIAALTLIAVALGVSLLAVAVALVLVPGGDDRPTDAPSPASVAPAEPAEGSGISETGDGVVRPVHEPEATTRSAAGGDDEPGQIALVEPVVPTNTERVPAVDPFTDPLPASLRRYHRLVERGRPLSRRDRRALFQVQRATPTDPRPTLILAHQFVDISYYSDALDRYGAALEIDPGCRGDREMLVDLLQMVRSPAVTERASSLVVRAYGQEAAPEVERAIAREVSPEALGLLTRLRTRIANGS